MTFKQLSVGSIFIRKNGDPGKDPAIAMLYLKTTEQDALNLSDYSKPFGFNPRTQIIMIYAKKARIFTRLDT